MTGTLNSDSQLALLLSGQTSLSDWFDTTVNIDVALHGFDIFIIEIKIWIVLDSSHFSLFSRFNY